MFNINGEEWRVHSVPPYHPKLLKSDGNYSLGVCDDGDKIIYISDNISDFLVKKVLCHEIVHAAMFSYNVNLNYDQEEVLADLVATYGQEIIKITNEIFKKLKGAF